MRVQSRTLSLSSGTGVFFFFFFSRLLEVFSIMRSAAVKQAEAKLTVGAANM